MNLTEELAEAVARVARIKEQLLSATCAEAGHDWRHIGGKNAGCGDEAGHGCGCSVPVHECSRCGDCDYGENEWAEEKRLECAAHRAGEGE